jgi:hypothetical protein
MELVIGLFASAATAAPAAVGTAVAGATAASTALSVLQGGLTAASALFSLASGFSEGQAEDQAGQLEAQRIKREELQNIGKLRVAFAGSGIDISSGQPATLEDSIREESAFERELAIGTGSMRAANARLRGFGQAAGTASNALIDIARRG